MDHFAETRLPCEGGRNRFSLEKHLESLYPTEGGLSFVVCGIREDFDH